MKYKEIRFPRKKKKTQNLPTKHEKEIFQGRGCSSVVGDLSSKHKVLVS